MQTWFAIRNHGASAFPTCLTRARSVATLKLTQTTFSREQDVRKQKQQKTGAFEPGTFTGSSNGCLLWLAFILAVGFGAIGFLLVAIQSQFSNSEAKLDRITELVRYDYPVQVSYPIASTPRARRPIELTDANASPITLVSYDKPIKAGTEEEWNIPDVGESNFDLARRVEELEAKSTVIVTALASLIKQAGGDSKTYSVSQPTPPLAGGIISDINDGFELGRNLGGLFGQPVVTAPIAPPITYSVEAPRMPVQSFSGGSTGSYSAPPVVSFSSPPVSGFGSGGSVNYSALVRSFSPPVYSTPFVSTPQITYSGPTRQARAAPLRAAAQAFRGASQANQACRIVNGQRQ